MTVVVTNCKVMVFKNRSQSDLRKRSAVYLPYTEEKYNKKETVFILNNKGTSSPSRKVLPLTESISII